MKKIFINIIKLSIGIIILFLLFYKVGFSKIYLVVREANPWIIIVFPTIYILSIFIGAVNLNLLCRRLKKIRHIEFFKYFWLSSSLALLLPGKIGNFSLLYFIKKKGISIGEGTSLVLLDKILTVIMFSFFAIVGFFLFFGLLEAVKFLLILLVLFLFSLFLLFSRVSRSLIKKYILRKYSIIFKGFSKTFFHYLKYHKLLVAMNFTITLIKHIVISTGVYFVFLSLNQEISLIYILIIAGIEFIVSLIPITPSGLGIRESVGLFIYYNILGIGYPIAASRYVVGLTTRYIIAALSFIIFGDIIRKSNNSKLNKI